MTGVAFPDHPGLLPAVFLGEPTADHRPPPRSGRDWGVDVVAFLLSAGSGAFLLSQAPGRVPDWYTALDVVAGVVCCLALWWRRRWPVAIGLGTAAVSCFSTFAGVAALVALFTVALHRRLPAVGVLVVANFVSGLALAMVRRDRDLPLYVTVVIIVLLIAGVVAWGLFTRARRQIVLSLRDRARRAEAEQQMRMAQARQLERTRIAREMHDVLAHRISLVSLHAGALEYSAAAAPEDVARSAAIIRESAHAALQDLREILGVLRADVAEGEPAVERPQPTLNDLDGLIAQSRDAGANVVFQNRVGDVAAVPTSVARTAYRVVQEGLTNARKHAPHAAVVVRVEGGPGTGLAVDIRNRGSVRVAAGEAIPGAGQGIAGLIERTVIAGGRLEHGHTPDGDFRLAAWLPWAAA